MHINSFSSLAILVWSYGALEVQAAALRSGGYINSCNSLAYFKSTVNPKGWTIVGNCARSATDYNVDARIVIGTCIGNVGGKLVYLPGYALVVEESKGTRLILLPVALSATAVLM